MPADEVLVALTVGMKNQSLETTIAILIRELPSPPFLAILVMQHKNAFKCTELKTGQASSSWNLQVSKSSVLVFLSLLDSLDSS